MDGNQLLELLQAGSALTVRLAKLLEKRTVFCGSGPFPVADLAKLHPNQQQSFVAEADDQEVLWLAAEEQIDIVVLGADWHDRDGLEIILEECSADALVLSQVGFLALAIFEQDWWNGARPGLPGRGDMMAPFPLVESILEYAGVLEWPELISEVDESDEVDDLGQVGDDMDDDSSDAQDELTEDEDDSGDDDDAEFDPDLDSFDDDDEDDSSIEQLPASWWPEAPSAPSSAIGSADYEPTGAEVRFRESTIIRGKYGYQIRDRTPQERWSSLVRAVAGEGLKLVAEELAGLPRARRLQRGGREKFRQAIEDWEHDLSKLKVTYYKGGFPWPSTEPSVRRQTSTDAHHPRPLGTSYARR
jgi:hypothetical protein